MLARLNEIHEASGANEYFGDQQLKQALQRLEGAQAAGDAPWMMLWSSEVARHQTLQGHAEEALKNIARAERLAQAMNERQPGALPSAALGDLYYIHGVAAFRKAENDNCVHCTDSEGCLFPISEKGIHQRQEGSSEAVKYLTKTLEIDPSNRKAIWLLNIAHMTLGSYPEGVPEQYRIPEQRLESEADFPRFPNIAADLGVDTLSLSGGAIADDFDGDNDLDIVVSDWKSDGQIEFFRNDGESGFTRRTEQANLTGIFGGLNINQADYDNDGDLDVFVMRGAWLAEKGRQPNSLLQNDGTGRFLDVTYECGLGDQELPTQTSAWADYDNDGDLDLYIGNEDHPNQLFENDGTGRFQDVANSGGVADPSYTKGVNWGDFNGDRLPDLYVSNGGSENRLYRNNGDRTFTDVAPELGLTKPKFGFPTWFWDYDNDGHLDLLALSFRFGVKYLVADYLDMPGKLEPDRLYRNTGDGGFEEVAQQVGLNAVTEPMGCNFGDLDNDGFLDFYLGTGYPGLEGVMPNLMYRNQEGKQFVDVTRAGGFGHLQKGHGVAFADFDHDGDQDVFAELGGAYGGDAFQNALFENPGFDRNWIKLRLIGEQSNRSAIGAHVKLTILEDGQRRSIHRWVNSGSSFGGNPLRREIGVGAATEIESIEVHWPTTDHRQVFRDVAVNQLLEIREFEPKPKRIQLEAVTF